MRHGKSSGETGGAGDHADDLAVHALAHQPLHHGRPLAGLQPAERLRGGGAVELHALAHHVLGDAQQRDGAVHHVEVHDLQQPTHQLGLPQHLGGVQGDDGLQEAETGRGGEQRRRGEHLLHEQREQLQVDGERLLVDEGVDRVRQQPARRVVARHARLAQRALQEHHHRLLLRVDGRATDRAGQKQTQALYCALADARHGGGQCPQQTLHRRLEGQLEQRLRHCVRVAAPALVALLPALQLVLRRAQHLALRRPGPRPQQQQFRAFRLLTTSIGHWLGGLGG